MNRKILFVYTILDFKSYPELVLYLKQQIRTLIKVWPICTTIMKILTEQVEETFTFDEVVDLLPPSTGGGVELEGPQEVGGVLEVGPNGQDLVDKILNADKAVLAKVLLDNFVGSQGGSVTVNLE